MNNSVCGSLLIFVITYRGSEAMTEERVIEYMQVAKNLFVVKL